MFKTGLRVIHPVFGAGTIRVVSGSGDQAKLTIDFSSSVGQKKLLAGVANLKILDPESSVAAPQNIDAWFEILEAAFTLRPNQRRPGDDVHARIQADVARPDFLAAVRERVRAAGKAPRVLDDPAGHISVRSSGNLVLRVVVRHPELLRADDAALTYVIADVLAARQLQEFQRTPSRATISTTPSLDEDEIITPQDGTPDNLPDRAPLRRPIREQPKGQIRARPKSRDDY